MSLPASGSLSFNQIGVELQRADGAILDIKDAELGVYVPLNVYSTYKPDGVTPCSVSEWYSYNHTQSNITPYFQIVKNAPSSVNTNTNFNVSITVANIGNASTSGQVTVNDILPTNMQYVTYNAPGWAINVTNQTITATRNDALGANNAYPDITITVKIINCATGAYYNQASVSGGGTNATTYSNTTTTNAYYFSSSKTITRSIQKNDCGAGCVGTFVNVTSPEFTRTSCTSQGDADALATQDCNNWLDANGQAVANSNGSCVCNPPVFSLGKSRLGSGTINIGQQFTWQIAVTVSNNNTTGSTVTITDTIDSNFSVISCEVVNPSGWNTFISGQTANAYTNNTLIAGQTYYFNITVQANASGTFNNTASVYGGGGNTANGSASITIAAATPISLTILSANVDRQMYSSTFLDVNYFGIYAQDLDTLNHNIAIRIANQAAAPYSINIKCNFTNGVFVNLFGNGLVPNGTDWGFDQVDSVFYNKTTINPGDYSFTYVAYIASFTGTNSSNFSFALKYNGSTVDSRDLSNNIVSRVDVTVIVQTTSSFNGQLLFENTTTEPGHDNSFTNQVFTVSPFVSLNNIRIYVQSEGFFNYNIFNTSKSIRYKLDTSASCPTGAYTQTTTQGGGQLGVRLMADGSGNLISC